MCGIWGTTDADRHRVLYKLNADRGNFACSTLYAKNDHIYVQKRKTSPDQTDTVDIDTSYDYYLGHTQSPTSSQREYTTETSHPFQVGDWYVAHNGVLDNDRDIARLLGVTNPVDTAVIPALLHGNYTGNEVSCIERAFSALKGTFGCWIYNAKSKNTYLVRCGSTLFSKGLEFSSRQDDEMEPLQEGIVYRVDIESKEIVDVGEFTFDSPYLIL